MHTRKREHTAFNGDVWGTQCCWGGLTGHRHIQPSRHGDMPAKQFRWYTRKHLPKLMITYSWLLEEIIIYWNSYISTVNTQLEQKRFRNIFKMLCQKIQKLSEKYFILYGSTCINITSIEIYFHKFFEKHNYNEIKNVIHISFEMFIANLKSTNSKCFENVLRYLGISWPVCKMMGHEPWTK